MKVIGYYVIVAALLALTLRAGPSLAADDRNQDCGPAASDPRANLNGADKAHSAEHTQDFNCQDTPAEEGECYECVLPPQVHIEGAEVIDVADRNLYPRKTLLLARMIRHH
ncbi:MULTISPECIES: nodulation protein NolE [Rhizobium]|uniref:Nodulation protein NolE n=1 Tax=Rhizobium phaseoli TaxID=396 RepID=A0A7X6F8B7_9HYPH|nr:MULTISPECIES: nodulation protein NolE [Rhizobium]ANL37384.1 nodulation protein NolE [Rhizobium phaseoli]ANL43768.1 nodulation protein NolE [Rhizobium phaseoli]ANL50039.1 nodulation protein NolE [Rhizobium phaseoli]ANL62749.1 nodulation protein NolE [Rhizobium phaseoli]ANM01095.1 nodulation protein NolE [Rhizobium phaseoli]